ncbi:hypothetical protein, partial [Escherichia coli]|uniref:hypothetical protein n=1 Tax=Escherichia coli TaxID=562 RepID=UPI001E35842D
EWVHVQLHQQKGMISLSPPTICNSASFRPSNLRQACSSFTIFATEPTRVLSIVEIGADHF